MKQFAFIFVLLLALTALSVGNAVARDRGDKGETAQKRALILHLYEVVPPRRLVDASIEAVATARYGPEGPERDEFISRLQLAVDYDALEAGATDDMAQRFTLPELKAMVDYYTSPVGQAAEEKMRAHRAAMGPRLKSMLDKAVMDYVTTPSPAESAGAVR